MGFRSVCCALAVAVLAGCKHYEAKPLDFAAHRALWEARSPESAEVAAFAQKLAESGPMTAPYDVADGLHLAEAEVVTLVFNPELRRARAEAGVAAASANFAGLLDDPVIDVNVLRILSSVPDPWIIGSSVGFTLPLSGRLQSEKDQASAELAAAQARAAQREWEVVNELRRAWIDWSAAKLQAEVAGALLDDLDRVVAAVSKLEAAGERSTIEGRLFRIEAASRQAALKQIELRAADLERSLLELMGLRPGAPLALVPQLDVSVSEASLGDEPMALENNPAIVVARAEYTVAERELEREIRKQFPDLFIGPAYENEDDQSRIGFVGSIPIPMFNRNQRGIAEAEARREAARAAAEQAVESVMHQLDRAREQLHRQRDIRAFVETTLVPLVDEQVEGTRKMMEIGELDTLVQLESLVRAADAKLELIDVRQAEAQAAARVREILGPETSLPLVDDNEGASP